MYKALLLIKGCFTGLKYLFSSATNMTQRYTIYLFLWNSLHISGGSSAHRQEIKLYIQHWVICQTVTATCHCHGREPLLLPATVVAGSSNGLTKYPMLYIQFYLLMMGGGTAWNMQRISRTQINGVTLRHVGCTWKCVCYAQTHERHVWNFIVIGTESHHFTIFPQKPHSVQSADGVFQFT